MSSVDLVDGVDADAELARLELRRVERRARRAEQEVIVRAIRRDIRRFEATGSFAVTGEAWLR